MNTLPTIFVAEPDAATCESIRKVAGVLELRCEAYATGQEFLDAFDTHRPGCLVLEIRIPGVNGLQIQQTLVEMGADAADDLSHGLGERFDRGPCDANGSVSLLEKPFHEHDLLSAVQEAIQVDQERRKARSSQEAMDARVSVLSEKECAVLELLTECKSKQAMAEEMGVSIRTIEHHRTQLMRKLKTNSIAGLLRFALTLKHASARLPGKSLLASHDGNGFGNGNGMFEFTPHNGHHAQQPLHGPLRPRSPK